MQWTLWVIRDQVMSVAEWLHRDRLHWARLDHLHIIYLVAGKRANILFTCLYVYSDLNNNGAPKEKEEKSTKDPHRRLLSPIYYTLDYETQFLTDGLKFLKDSY